MKINSIHHVAIICSDYQRSKKFYTDIVGCTVLNETFRAERGSFKLDLCIGKIGRIELFSFPNPPTRVDQPEACGLRHLALEVDDVGIAKIELEQKGVAVETIRTDSNGKQFTFFKDPDGLPIELFQK